MTAADAKPLDSGTRLAVDRTQLAHERTLMAWVRTATSLITFGFTVYKFFSFEAGRGLPAGQALVTPRTFGMTLIAIGLVALALSTVEHRRSMRRLRVEFGVTTHSTSAIVATIVAAMGLLALVAAILRA